VEQPHTHAKLDLENETITISVTFRARHSTEEPPNEECRKNIPMVWHKMKIEMPIDAMWMVADDNEAIPTRFLYKDK
jgi:hypothetical protein